MLIFWPTAQLWSQPAAIINCQTWESKHPQMISVPSHWIIPCCQIFQLRHQISWGEVVPTMPFPNSWPTEWKHKQNGYLMPLNLGVVCYTIVGMDNYFFELLFFFIMVDLQCSVNFWYTAKWPVFLSLTHTHTHSFFSHCLPSWSITRVWI